MQRSTIRPTPLFFFVMFRRNLSLFQHIPPPVLVLLLVIVLNRPSPTQNPGTTKLTLRLRSGQAHRHEGKTKARMADSYRLGGRMTIRPMHAPSACIHLFLWRGNSLLFPRHRRALNPSRPQACSPSCPSCFSWLRFLCGRCSPPSRSFRTFHISRHIDCRLQ